VGVITDEARRWAAREFPVFEYPVSPVDIARYARATGETDPIHFDREAAVEQGYADVVAPPYFPYVIRMHAANLVDRDELAPDGSSTADVPPIETTRAMAGETTLELGEPVVAGDTVTVEKRIVDLYEKEGRSGALVFVVQEFTFRNQRGDLVARERFTRIYR
jgi:hydroxyacyl-ACP dehydratase HTD2-like protein with hotdog domain